MISKCRKKNTLFSSCRAQRGHMFHRLQLEITRYKLYSGYNVMYRYGYRYFHLFQGKLDLVQEELALNQPGESPVQFYLLLE